MDAVRFASRFQYKTAHHAVSHILGINLDPITRSWKAKNLLTFRLPNTRKQKNLSIHIYYYTSD